METNWVTLIGKMEVSKAVIKHIPVEPSASEQPQTSPLAQPPITLARSNVSFENGIITFEVFLPDAESRCQVGLNQGLPTEIYAGLNVQGAAYGISLFRNGKWENLSSTGFGDTPTLKHWIPVKLSVTGSLVEMFINEVKVCSGSTNVFKSQIGLLFQGTQDVSVRNFSVVVNKPRAFVVMQFTEEFNTLYREVIKPTCENFGFDVIRADDSYTSGLIIEDITRSIEESSIIIADITPDNPNVFYEVGYAHGIRKPTILLSDRRREKLPFDVSGFRTLFYDNTIGGKGAVEGRLKKHLENIAA